MIGSLIAQNTGKAELDLGSSYTLRGGTPVSEVFSTPADLVNLIVPNLFVIAGVTLMILIIVAGYQYIAKGQKGAEEAKKIGTTAFFGLVVLLGAYWVVQIIQLVTGADIPL
jgi:hypothetical protein